MSNRLQALLKSNKIDISVGLDEEKSLSNIKKGLQTLRTKLDGLDIELGVKFNPNVKELNGEIRALQTKINETATVKNAIKLDVEINSSIKALNAQILQLQDKIQNSKTIKPIKIGVEVDVAGSAKKMTDELTRIKSVLDKFESDYSSALKNVEKMGSANIGNIVSDEATNKLQRNLDTIKQSMNETFGDGLVSTKTIRDSENNITAFSSTVKRETGEMITAYHRLNEEGNLELFSTTQVNKMEEQTAKAKRSINSLSDEIKKVKSVLGESQSFDLFEKLGKQEFVSSGEVQKLRDLVKVEKELIATNQKRKEFQDALTQSMKRMSPEVSSVANEVKKLDVSLEKLDSNELDKMSQKLKELNSQYKQEEQIFNKRNANLKEQQILYDRLALAYDKMSKSNSENRRSNEIVVDLLEEAKALNKTEASMKDLDKATRLYAQARQEISKIEFNTKIESSTKAMEKQSEAIKKTIQDLKNIGKYNGDDVTNAMLKLEEKMATSERSVREFGDTLKREFNEAKQEQKDLIKNFILIEKHTDDLSKKKIQNGIFESIGNKDTHALKAYISELKGAEVNTISIREKTNQFGQAVDEIKVKMAGTGKTVEAYSFEVNKASKATDLMVKETGRAFVDNENKALGFFEQMNIAMKRIPAWIVSMQSFYAVMNGFKAVGREIMEIDAQLIEIRRVAGEGINVDSLFASAVTQSKELGVNIHEVLDALGEFSRSYGDMTESQLMAVNKTAVMMANVSDLSLGQSVESLVGTMNAFNITAEESIHIVDALNEVDNNYSISTQQLATSISKAGATATTFGVTMEELAGHTTAVGAVTMESGDIIGNSLKTIYSRITTMQPSIDILDSIGVSINKMGESGVEARSVGEILGDVAGKWGTLTDSQRQNIGVTIAGRNQLSRFLALMNNWGMAQDATNAAINSTGSALKEQEVYMGSYEAKVNGLKTRFTELALGIGEAFLSDGMYLALDGIADLTEGVTKLIEKIGVLPTMVGGIAVVAGKMTGLTSGLSKFLKSVGEGESVLQKFKTTASSILSIADKASIGTGLTGKLQSLVLASKTFGTTMAGSFSMIKTGLSTMATQMVAVRSGIATATVAQSGFALVTQGVTTAFTALGGVVKTFMFSAGGVGLLIAGAGIAIGKLIEKTIKAKKETEELLKTYDENNKKALESYNAHGNNIDKLIEDYKRLHQAKLDAERAGGELDPQSLQEYEQAVNGIAQAMPNAISYTDANGKAHLKSSKLIEQEAKMLEKLNKEQIAVIKSDYQESLKKRGEDYQKLLKDFEKYSKTVESYEKAQENKKKNQNASSTGMNTQTNNMWTPMVTSTKDYEKSLAGAQRAQGAMSMALSESSVAIGENVRQLLTADGALKNTSDAGKAVIDSYAKMNQASIESIKTVEDFNKAQDDLQIKTMKFGKQVAQAYDDIAKGMDKSLGEKGKGLLDGLLSGFDEKFFKQSSDDIEAKLKGLSKAIIDMSNNSADFNIDEFQASLEESGYSANEAKEATMKLGTELNNTAIKSQIATDEMSSYNDELVSMSNATWEAIDAKKAMLGLADGESEDITSRLEYLQAMKEMNEETWLQNAKVQEELDNLQKKTGISKERIQENTLAIFEAYSTMTKASAPEIAKFTNMTREQLREANKDMSEEGLTLLQTLLANMKNGTQEVSVALIQALSQGAKEIDGKTEEVKKSFEKLKQSPNDTNVESSVFNGIKKDLEALQGQITLVKNDAGELQLAMLSGERSTYLDEVNKQLEDMGIKLEVVKGVDGNNVIHFAGADGELHKLASLNTELDIMGISTALLTDNFQALQANMNDTTEAQWITGIKTQFETLKEEVELVGKGTEDAKLQLAGGEDSPWLNELNRQVKALNGEIVETKNKAGDLEYVLKIGDKEYPLFSGMKQGAEQAKAETEKAKESVSELQKKGKEGITVNMNPLAGALTVSAKEEQNKAQADLDLSGGLKTKVNVDDTDYKEKTEEINKTTAEPKPFNIEMKIIEQADGTLETTQRRIQTLVENMTSLEVGTQQVVSLIDEGIVAKDPLVQSLASKLGELAEIATNAKKQIEELANTIRSTEFKVEGKFEITGLDTAEKQINDLAKTLSGSTGGIKTAMAQLQSSMNGLKIGKVDTSELTRFKATVIQVMNETTALLATYGTTVAQAVAQANASMTFNTTGLLVYRNVTTSTINSMIVNWNTLRATLPNIIVSMGQTMNQAYNQATNAISQRTDWLRQQLTQKFMSLTTTVVRQMQVMTSMMVSTFRSGTRDLANVASDIPRQIGNGITRNMNSATNSLQSLADNMVKRFKSALGIHSPSRVFEELGGFVIQGLTNGLTGGDLKSLGTQVFKDFSGGAMSSIDDIKMFMEGGWAGSPNFGGSFVLTSPFGGRGNEFHRGDDYGAPMGTPIRAQAGGKVVHSGWMGSYGNMIEIALGNGMSMRYAHNSRNMVGVGQTVKAGQIIGLVGSTGNSTGPHVHFEVLKNGQLMNPRGFGKFANGGFINNHQFAEIGEEGREVIIPLIEKRRKRGIELWLETAKHLGITDGLSARYSHGSNYAYGGAIGGYGVADGESSSGGGGAEGMSGTVSPSISMPAPNLTFKGVQPAFELSDNKSLEALYKRDTAGLEIDKTESFLTKANQRLKTLNEGTVEYRTQIRVIQKLNQQLLAQEKQQLAVTQRRQKAIEKELIALKNTGKHTEAQRKKYNELQQEYDNNTKQIWKLEESIDALNTTIHDFNISNHIDYLNEISSKYDEVIAKFERANSKLNFEYEKMQLQDPTNVGGQLALRYDMLEEQYKIEDTQKNKIGSIRKEYDYLMKWFGANDKRTIEAKKMLEKAEDDYQKEVLETLKLEKSIKDEREKVAKDSITALKSYYKQMESLSKNALAKEKENLKKSHDEKIKYYDKEIAKINEVYDAKFKEREEEKSEKAYAEKMTEYNEKRSELMQKISMASKDTSIEGKKRVSQLQKELLDLNKEIAKAQEDRHDELWKKELEAQKQQQLDALNNQKEIENDIYDSQLQDIESREKAIADYYKKMTSDEAMWKKATDAWNAGDTSILTNMMNDMREGMSAIMGGNGVGIMGTENLTPEDLKELLGDNMIDISNIWLEISDQLKELDSINNNLGDLNAKDQNGYQLGNLPFRDDANAKPPTTSQNNVSPNLTEPKKPAPKPNNNGVKGYHTVVRGDTLWDLAKKYYGDYYKWTKIQKANGNINPYTLPIGKKLVIPMRTGGYTGDWVGDEGRVALLHKKELVLNQQQTRDILDTVSILDKANSKFLNQADKLRVSQQQSVKNNITKFGDINLHFDGFKGTKQEANYVAEELLKSLGKKR